MRIFYSKDQTKKANKTDNGFVSLFDDPENNCDRGYRR